MSKVALEDLKADTLEKMSETEMNRILGGMTYWLASSPSYSVAGVQSSTSYVSATPIQLPLY